MKDAFIFANLFVFLLLWAIGLWILYLVIKTAVRNGVHEANMKLEQQVEQIRDLVQAIAKVHDEGNK